MIGTGTYLLPVLLNWLKAKFMNTFIPYGLGYKFKDSLEQCGGSETFWFGSGSKSDKIKTDQMKKLLKVATKNKSKKRLSFFPFCLNTNFWLYGRNIIKHLVLKINMFGSGSGKIIRILTRQTARKKHDHCVETQPVPYLNLRLI